VLERSTRLASWSGVAHPFWLAAVAANCGRDFAGCGDERGGGVAGWAGEFAPAFGQTAPGDLVGLQRWHQSLEKVAVDVSSSRGGLSQDARAACD
jgi:hypothetical protein